MGLFPLSPSLPSHPRGPLHSSLPPCSLSRREPSTHTGWSSNIRQLSHCAGMDGTLPSLPTAFLLPPFSPSLHPSPPPCSLSRSESSTLPGWSSNIRQLSYSAGMDETLPYCPVVFLFPLSLHPLGPPPGSESVTHTGRSSDIRQLSHCTGINLFFPQGWGAPYEKLYG